MPSSNLTSSKGQSKNCIRSFTSSPKKDFPRFCPTIWDHHLTGQLREQTQLGHKEGGDGREQIWLSIGLETTGPTRWRRQGLRKSTGPAGDHKEGRTR